MPRVRPTTKLGTYGGFDLSPENALSLVKSGQQMEKFFMKSNDQVGLDLFGVRTERKLVDLRKDQCQKREDVKEYQKRNEAKLEAMYKVQKEMHLNFIEINDFIRNCAEKEENASKKIDEEIEKQKQLEEEIKEQEESLKKLLEFKGKMEVAVDDFKEFEEIINEVVQESEHFVTVKDLMDKCDALMMAQVEISAMEEEKIKEIDEFRQTLVAITNDAETSVLGLNNVLSSIDKSYAKAKAESLKWERVLADTRDFIVSDEIKTNRVLDSIRQMYLLLCRRNNVDPNLKKVSVDAQLDYIKEEIEILRDVLAEANAFMEKEQKSLVGEFGTNES